MYCFYFETTDGYGGTHTYTHIHTSHCLTPLMTNGQNLIGLEVVHAIQKCKLCLEYANRTAMKNRRHAGPIQDQQ
jgi:hypothetical protein